MRVMLTLGALSLALLCATNAGAVTGDSRYDAIATAIAQQPLTVACYSHHEVVDSNHMDPDIMGAWGYVYLEDTIVNLAPEVCDGLTDALQDRASVWAGLGALVLTHEAYHLAKRYETRGNEAKTECRAIKNVRTTIAALGLRGDQARATYFWALTWDWQEIWLFPQYFDRSCKRDSSGEVPLRSGELSRTAGALP